MAFLSDPRADEQAYRDHERSVLAMFVALGGTSYAVATIGSKQIKNNSVRSVDIRNGAIASRDVKRGSLGGRSIQESSLGTVPRSSRVGGKSASQLTLRCPAGTAPSMGSCIETAPRPALAYGLARVACELNKRRLPMHQELAGWIDDSPSALAPGGELTANVFPPSAPSDGLRVLIVVSQTGKVDTVPDTFAGRKGFRCIANPVNG
jgi:hypothetical protein